MSTQTGIVEEILQERRRQDRKWGDSSRHSNLYWLGILVEEVGEVAKDLIESSSERNFFEVLDCKDESYRFELIRTAAVCLAWLEAIDQRR